MLADDGPRLAEPFDTIEHATFSWTRRITRDELFAMVQSRSYVITAAPDERDRIEGRLAELFDEVGAVGDARIELPYVTQSFRARRP